MTALCRSLRRYLVTDAAAGTPERLLAICEAALGGGMTVVQLRVKGWSDRDALDAAHGLRALCTAAHALFLVNDRVDIALASGADGVHLGVDDLPVSAARRLLGPDAVIGYSPEVDADRRAAALSGADYLGVGPVFATNTKHDAGSAIGLEGLARVARMSALPTIGVGGISLERAAAVRETGAVGVAVVGAVFLAESPADAARRLAELVP